VFATLLLALTPGQYVENKDFPRDKQEAALAATAGILHTATNGEGTAVVVKYDKVNGAAYLLTAAHVVPPGKDGDLVSLDFYTPKTFPKVDRTIVGIVMARSANEDIAVIQAPLKNLGGLQVLRICPVDHLPTPEKFPFPVLTVGCDGPNRTARLLTDVVPSKKRVDKPNGARVLCWETQGIPVQGRSGGPLIDKRGYVMGICSGTENQRGYYTYILEIHKALSGAGFGWLVRDELKVPAKQAVGFGKNPEKN
jgi:Trypsin-like peptidase domain